VFLFPEEVDRDTLSNAEGKVIAEADGRLT
jgi:hypothetical protein